jgi:tRNA modification GTPase
MPDEPSIAILLTPPGAAAIAVLRLAGRLVPSFLRAHFSGPAAPGRCVHGNLTDAGHILDDPVIVLSADSLTADLNLHGGPWVVRSALEMAERFGFVAQASPDLPLPPAAVDADSEIERDVLSHLPLARTELALRELLRQPAAWSAFDQLPIEDRRRQALEILADCSLHWLLHPPRVAIAGAPNVGKSTLANQLFAQERSITADLPGTTRDWVGETANLDGLAVTLVDTPGIRRTDDAIEAMAIERSARELTAADLVLLVLDASRPLDPDQSPLLAQFPRAIRISNKADLPPAWDIQAVGGLAVCATTGSGVEDLRQSIRDHFGIGNRPPGPKCWTEHQRDLLKHI